MWYHNRTGLLRHEPESEESISLFYEGSVRLQRNAAVGVMTDRLTDEEVQSLTKGWADGETSRALAREVQALRAWKAEATAVINKWELAYDLIVPAGYARLGAFKQTELVNYVNTRMSASAQQRIDRVVDDCESKPLLNQLPFECDWGYCSRMAVNWRWSDAVNMWLPVCMNHLEGPHMEGPPV